MIVAAQADMAQPADSGLGWLDGAVLALIVMTFALSAGRMILGVVEREPFGGELSFALVFLMLSLAALVSELSFRIARRRLSR